MRRYWTWKTIGKTTLGTVVALSGPTMLATAQENQQRTNQEQQERQSSESQSERKQSDGQAGKQADDQKTSDQQRDNEVRLQYDDDKNRLSIDVDDEIQFKDQSDRRDVLREGEFDLRYDRDKNHLRTSGEGTIDMDRAASQMGRWWQSWWEDERQARRGRTEGAAVGATEFVRQYDDNNDQHLSRRELPPHMRDDFDELDRNGDNYLSRMELSRYGEIYYDQRNRTTGNQPLRSTASNTDDDRTWSQWWSSWWSEDQSGGSQQEVATTGSRQLIRAYDRNDDGYLSKTELPVRMREDFEFVDRNNDGYISRNEVQQYGYALRMQARGRNSSYAGTADNGQSNSTSQARNASQARSNSQARNDDDQTWSQWWSSWWSDENSGQSSQEVAASGAQQFLRQHDDNNDGLIVRSEMPQGMYDEFQRIDTNDDRRLSRQEISAYAARTGEQLANRNQQSGQANDQASRQQSSGSTSQGSSQRSRNSQTADPMNTAYVWVIDANHGHLERKDLQEAYSVLRKLDTNSDGEISQSELEKRREQVVSEWCEKCFVKMDSDGDDRLTREEAQNSMFADSFDQYDRNDDNRLSKSEAQQGVQRELESQSASRTQSGQSNRR